MLAGMTVAAGLQGALMLARGRAEGILHVDAGRAGAARSFWAAALCLPAFLCLRFLDWSVDGLPGGVTAVGGHTIALELLAYGTGWLGFAVASHAIARRMGREARWPLFIAAWNWCNVVQYMLLVAAALPRLLGAPEMVDQTAELVALGWALWLEWYATRIALGIDGLAAGGLVGIDLAIGLLLSAITG
jgi:hypothetical protein